MSLAMYRKKQPVVIAVASGKGGVGKSTVAVHLAVSLKERGAAVGLLDADIYGPSLRRMLPEERQPVQKESVITPALCRGIKMISMAYFRREMESSSVRAPIANAVLRQFLDEVEWGNLDYLVVDLPPGTGDIQLTLCQAISVTGALLVTTPQQVAVMDVRKAAHMFHQVKVPLFGIVENMSYYTDASGSRIPLFGSGGGEDLAAELGVPLLANVPIDPCLAPDADVGLVAFDRDLSPSADAFRMLSDGVLEQIRALASPLISVHLIDSRTLAVQWGDGTEERIDLAGLQRQCPCAACHEMPPSTDVKTHADEVRLIGRYAVKFRFRTGCSNGLYKLDLLKKEAVASV